jgi:hypothetical protein
LWKIGPCWNTKAAGFRAIDLGAGNVGRQQIRGELDAMELGFDALGEFFDRFGLGQTRRALDQHVAVGEQGDEQTLDEFFLAENLR